MALSFNSAKAENTGGSDKEKLKSYQMKMGDNRVRFVGGILARRIYWIPNAEGKKTPVEDLSFSRETEKHDSGEKDWVKEYFPDAASKWGYASLCIDLDSSENELLIFNHKITLYNAIVDMVEDLGDPSDPDNGWDLVFSKDKNGPKVMNVAYNVKGHKCKHRPLTEEERTLVENSPSIDEVLSRPKAEDIKKYLDKLTGQVSEDDESIDDDIPDDFN